MKWCLLVAIFVGLIFTICFDSRVQDFWYKRGHAGLLNYDYGIVSVADLRFSDKNSLPPSPRHEGYPYWQCFRSDQLKSWCTHSDEPAELGSSLNLVIETSSESHLYALNHGISDDVCNDLLTEISAVLKDQEHFCLNGTYHVLEPNGPQKRYLWFFYRLKTNKGYATYFHQPDMPE